jgi:hypothetical protein
VLTDRPGLALRVEGYRTAVVLEDNGFFLLPNNKEDPAEGLMSKYFRVVGVIGAVNLETRTSISINKKWSGYRKC